MLFLHVQPLGAAQEWQQALAGGPHGQDVGLGCCLLPKESTAQLPSQTQPRNLERISRLSSSKTVGVLNVIGATTTGGEGL